MVLAAAIKYQVDNSNKEIILCGARHGNILEQEETLGVSLTLLEEGFIDHKNNFLTREEAYEHAKMCGQVCEKIILERERVFGKKLISEDLW
jgi:hypothetical protein